MSYRFNYNLVAWMLLSVSIIVFLGALALQLTDHADIPGVMLLMMGMLAGMALLNWWAERNSRVQEQSQVINRLDRAWKDQMEQSAAQAERNRLARELHDSIKQQLFSIQMSAAACQARWETDVSGAKDALADVRRSAEEALIEMNALLQQLSPAPLEKVGLIQALRDQCEALGYRANARVDCRIGDLPTEETFVPGTQESLFRIAQEALANIARHARARNVTLSLGEDVQSGTVVLRIQDDGKGFDLQSLTPGAGLAGIRARVDQLSGKLEIASAPGVGTTLTVSIPLQEPLAQPSLGVQNTGDRLILWSALWGLFAALVSTVPAQFIGNGQILAWLLSAIFALGSGFTCARQVKAASGKAPALIGAACGGLTAMFTFGWVGAAWTGLAAAAALLETGAQPVSDTQSVYLVALGTTNVFWWVHIGFWVCLLAGAGLGAIGGVLASVNEKSTQSHSSWLPANLISTLVGSAGGAVLIATFVLTVGEGALISTAQQYGVLDRLPLSPHGISALGIGTPGAFFLIGLALRRYLLAAEESFGEDLRRLHWKAYASACLAFAIPAISAVYLYNPSFWEATEGGWRVLTGPVLTNALIGLASLIYGLLYLKKVEEYRRKMHSSGLLLPHPVAYAAPAIAPLIFIFALLALIAEFPGWLLLIALVVEIALFIALRYQKSAPSFQATHKKGAKPGSLLEVLVGLVTPMTPLAGACLAVYTLIIRLIPYFEAERQVGATSLPVLTSEMLVQQAQIAQAALFSGFILATLAVCGLYLVGFYLVRLNRRAANKRI